MIFFILNKVYFNNFELFKVLVIYGANTRLKNKDDKYPLDLCKDKELFNKKYIHAILGVKTIDSV